MKTQVRPDIQALRAFAIIAVTLFHLWPKNFGGGFVGVDVFFVISGFLITGALWREIETTGRVGFASFWARRARRLLPASLLVILLTSLASWVIDMPIGFLSFSDEAGAATIYGENFALLAKKTDYLASGGDPSPFQHFWSLSVEEQFYVVWPLLMFVALVTVALMRGWRLPGNAAAATSVKQSNVARRSIVLWLAAVALVSFAFNVWQTFDFAPVAYFSTATRAWEFTVGGLVAVWLGRSAELEKRRRPWWFIGGALAVFYSATMFDQQTVFPGWAALLPVLGAAALLYGGQSAHHLMPRRFVELKAWQFLGDISYSLYLWHWPLIILIGMWWGKDLNNVGKILIFGLAIFLGWLTKRFVEDPIRFGRLATLSALKQLGVAALAMLVAFAAIAGLTAGARTKVENSWASQHLNPPLLQLHDDWSSIEKNDNCVVSPSSKEFKVCLWGFGGTGASVATSNDAATASANDTGMASIALIGDSHARQLFDAVNAIAVRHHARLFVISKSHCEPMASALITNDYTEPTCKVWNQQLETYLASHKPFDVVVNMNAANYSSSSAGAAPAFKALVETQLSRGTKWLAIKDNPVPLSNFDSCLELLGQAGQDDCAVAPKVGFKHADHLSEVIKELPGVIYADFSDIFCTKTLCPPFIGSDIVYRDTNHLSRTFIEKYLKPRIEALLSKELKQ